MSTLNLPEDCAKQWEILLLLLSSEERKIDRTSENEIDTMNYFLKNEGVRKILLQWLNQMKNTYARKTDETYTSLKCDEVALQWRLRGNDKFRSNLVTDSYKCYTNSVLYATHNGPMYSLALANRSAALLRLKRFEECLLDVELAIKYGYPKEQRHKLLLRQTDCQIELHQHKAAKESLTKALQYANSLNLSATNALEFNKHKTNLEKKLEDLTGNVIKTNEAEGLSDFLYVNNLDYYGAANAIKLRRSESAGRYVVAKEDTKRGDVLFSEKPYAWVTLPSEEGVCEMCCQGDINLVPCSRCSRSVYCGEKCREHATFHRWECVGAQSSLFPTIGIAHLALRVLLISANNGFPLVPDTVTKENKTETAFDIFKGYECVDSIEIYKTHVHPFYRMFNLVTNFDKMNNTDYIQYALTATMLTLYLENFTSFFEFLPSKVPYALSEDQLRLFAAGIILRSLGQLICNGHATLSLATVDEGNGHTLTEKEVRRATAIYPSAAMMNHSCDPNIINTFYKSRLIIRCAREIQAGSEVFNCYGPHRAREVTALRRSQLRSQYMFYCTCSACNNTERRDFVLLFSAYACQSCKGPVIWQGKKQHCQQCRTEFVVDRALSIIDRAEELFMRAQHASNAEEKCEKVQSSYRLKQQVWYRHNASLRSAADELARLYADIGDFPRSVELIKQNIQSLEYQFGSFSVEVAHELRKLTDVMFERIINTSQHLDYRDWCLEAHKVIKKSVQLMELNYGSWEPLVARLKEQESLVASFLADSTTTGAIDCVHHNFHYNLKI